MLRRTDRFRVHSYEVDAFRQLQLPSLAGYLQESAGHHAVELGWGLEALQARGLTWVLARQRIEAGQPITLGDELEIATWPSGIHGLLATREFTVARGGVEVARASSAWLVLDLASRRPVRPAEVLDPALRPPLEPVAPIPARLPAPAGGGAERLFDVRYADIDVNQHVTHTSYLSWALESVPEPLWRSARPCAVEVHYLAEARLGDRVAACCAEGEGGWVHALGRAGGDGKELTRLRTRWTAR
jgi:acyl-ACP thioesterase